MNDVLRSGIQALRENDFYDLLSWVSGEERIRRETQKIVDAKINDLAREYHARTGAPAGPGEDPVAWFLPQAEWQAWPPMSLVIHAGKLWESALDTVNMAEPGTENSGWQEKPINAVPAVDNSVDAIPWQVGASYLAGDRVIDDQVVYQVVDEHEANEVPSVAVDLYEVVGPVEG